MYGFYERRPPAHQITSSLCESKRLLQAGGNHIALAGKNNEHQETAGTSLSELGHGVSMQNIQLTRKPSLRAP